MANENTDTIIIDNLLNICTVVVTVAFVAKAREQANYIRGLATKVRGINVAGNLSMYRKNLGIAEDMDALAFDVQHNALLDRSPSRYIERAVKRAHRAQNGAVRPRV